MYGRFTYPMTDPYVCHIWFAIYHQDTPVMLAYIPYMDPMGIKNGDFPVRYVNVYQRVP